MIYYVSVEGNDSNAGTAQDPFRNINHAAAVAMAGDTIRVYGGVYREWVDPRNSGNGEDSRIIYEAVAGEHPVIKGSEVVTGWERVEGTVWKVEVPNTMFGDWNPYEKKVEGDWMGSPKDYAVHLGDVYINGRSMYEASSEEDLYKAQIRHFGFSRYASLLTEPIHDPKFTVYRWWAQVNSDTTVIYGNFQQLDPNEQLTEINVRKACFYPRQHGRNYITLRGFEIAQAACPFTPPTADQTGMVGVHWSKGWIIENNDIHDAKCSGLSLGKDERTGDNECMRYNRKYSHYYQTEVVHRGLRSGWDKETVGSHVVRNNTIHDCGQNAIVGHMGGAFCRIEHNEIYNIAVKHEFHGAEIAGIKLHAAIDTVLEGNNIHHCTRGTWLDWQAQGTRVTRNLFYSNDTSDLMIEVTHGPCTVDNNIFMSPLAFENAAQGTAFVHNLIAGNMKVLPVPERDTPYHLPHSTKIGGATKTLGGDDRVYNNIILGQHPSKHPAFVPMNACYNRYETPEDYAMHTEKGIKVEPLQPVYIEGNAYAGLAGAFRAETTVTRIDGTAAFVETDGKTWYLVLDATKELTGTRCQAVTTQRLGTPIFTEEPFENPDGTPIDFAKDYFGLARAADVIPGPFAGLSAGTQKIAVWHT